MRSIPLILRVSRVLMAATMLAGPAGPAFAGFTGAPAQPLGVKTAQNAPALSAGLKIPRYFEANNGQTDATVKFFTRAAGYNLYLTGTEAVMVVPRPAAAKSRAADVLRMKLKGANAKPVVQGQEILPGRTSYFYGGDSSKWQVGVKQYAKVKLAQVYPGIDMVYRFEKGNVEYDFVVAPGANPWRILLGFEGAKGLKLDPKGNLVLRTGAGELTYKAPQLYQTLGGKRVSVKGRFVLASNNIVRFEVGNYIKTKELVIDPELVYSTYLGGSVNDQITGIAVDGTNQAYVVGSAEAASIATFPAATATFTSASTPGLKDVFVAKLSADGTTLMWLAWLGGTLNDLGKGIALDNSSVSEPKVYITGATNTDNTGAANAFPVFGPAMQICDQPAGTMAFAAELTQPGGTNPTLVYSTCWGGVAAPATNSGNAIAVDATGAAYITGTTEASDFPVVAAAGVYAAAGGASSGFVFKINPAGTGGVAYSMFLGNTSGTTFSNAIAVDTAGKAWVAGRTTSDTWPAAPKLGHFAETRTAGVWSDAFVAQVNAAGTGLDYMTYINGNQEDEATAIKLNNGGATPYNVFVAGWTVSDTDFPSTAYLLLPTSGPGSRPAVYQKDLVGADDPFIARLDPAASGIQEMVYATHLGATGADRAYALALDDMDDAYIAGWTLSSDWTLAADPVTPGANGINVTGATTQNTSGAQDAFVAAIGPTGQFQPFFSYLGATPGTPGLQTASGIVIDAAHNIYVAGYTPSAIFPLVTGSLMDGSGGAESINGTGTAGATDGFITKIAPVLSFGLPVPPACSITGINPNSGFAVGGATITITGSSFDGLFGPASVTFDVTNARSYTVNAASSVITAVTPAHAVGSVPLRVTTTAGSCTATYHYVTASVCGGKDFFFPSPATGNTAHFEYCMLLPGTVKIRVYNIIGDLAVKIEDSKGAGAQLSSINTGRLAPGVYLYRLEKKYDNGTSTTSGVNKFVVKH